MAPLQRLSKPRLAREMALSPKLAGETKALHARWGHGDEAVAPALFAFTGLVYKYVAAETWTAAQVRDAQRRLLILSGLYGLLRPLDQVAAYRLEMGSRFKPPRAANLVTFWRDTLTAELNARLKPGQPVLSLAAQEYVKALQVAQLKGPLICPVFKEVRPDGSLKTVPVHAKMARGALVKHVFTTGVKRPADLVDFGEMGWEATTEPPAAGPWLFTRPVRD
jgi:cytoplasmic iron level regulating protein YaaA (DUF328/UPF0246 family)